MVELAALNMIKAEATKDAVVFNMFILVSK
jgi:hypothetical protein